MKPVSIQLTDGLVSELARFASDQRREWGAALFGTGNLLTFALLDDRGRTNDLSWHLSTELRSLIPIFETFGVGRFAGTVHSHPSGLDHSSRTDVESTRRILSANPELGSTLICIISTGHPQPPNQLAIGPRHRMTADLQSADDTQFAVELSVASVVAGLEDAGVTTRSLACVSDTASVRSRVLEHSPRTWHGFGSAITLYPVAPELGLMLGFPANFPTAGPLLLRADGEGLPHVIASAWDPSRPARVQIRNMVESAVAALSPKARGVRRSVLIVGLENVGSAVADALARSNLADMTLVDGGRVSDRDIAAGIYARGDRGEWRVFALARHLAAVDPSIVVTSIPSPPSIANLSEEFARATVVVDAREDARPLALLDDARMHGIPVVTGIAQTLSALSVVPE